MEGINERIFFGFNEWFELKEMDDWWWLERDDGVEREGGGGGGE